jgi:hypothetical protein
VGAEVVASTTTPIAPPMSSGTESWDVDGDAIADFELENSGSSIARLDDVNGGRLVVPVAAVGGGISKMNLGNVVGATLSAGYKFHLGSQTSNSITFNGNIAGAGPGGWSVGDTGFFGFRFQRNGGADTHYGWGRLKIAGDVASPGDGYTILEAYYDDVPGRAIAVGALPPTPVVVVSDTTAPTLRVRGRKTIETLRKRVVIRGTASDASGIEDLEVKVRGAKVARAKVKADGTFKVVLRVTKDRGRVIAKLRAVDNAGLKSKRAKVRILRR